MDRLASCYFCGDAVDAPLEEYPVVPQDLRPSVENQQTVVLCPQCRRKLSTIVDSVVAAATDPDQTTLAGSDSDTSASGEGDTGSTAERTTGDVESAEDRSSDTSLIEGFGPDDEPSLIDVERTSADQASTTADDVDSEDESQRSESETSVSESPETTGDSHTGDTTADTAEEATVERDFSKSAYNRVVRLLQNRAFPLDVEEITTIAGSAYEIERRETEAIVDALVDRGVIERDGDQLFRPENGGD